MENSKKLPLLLMLFLVGKVFLAPVDNEGPEVLGVGTVLDGAAGGLVSTDTNEAPLELPTAAIPAVDVDPVPEEALPPTTPRSSKKICDFGTRIQAQGGKDQFGLQYRFANAQLETEGRNKKILHDFDRFSKASLASGRPIKNVTATAAAMRLAGLGALVSYNREDGQLTCDLSSKNEPCAVAFTEYTNPDNPNESDKRSALIYPRDGTAIVVKTDTVPYPELSDREPEALKADLAEEIYTLASLLVTSQCFDRKDLDGMLLVRKGPKGYARRSDGKRIYVITARGVSVAEPIVKHVINGEQFNTLNAAFVPENCVLIKGTGEVYDNSGSVFITKVPTKPLKVVDLRDPTTNPPNLTYELVYHMYLNRQNWHIDIQSDLMFAPLCDFTPILQTQFSNGLLPVQTESTPGSAAQKTMEYLEYNRDRFSPEVLRENGSAATSAAPSAAPSEAGTPRGARIADTDFGVNQDLDGADETGVPTDGGATETPAVGDNAEGAKTPRSQSKVTFASEDIAPGASPVADSESSIQVINPADVDAPNTPTPTADE